MHRSVRAALMATLLAAVPRAQAADITPEQAQALEGQVRSWAQNLLGPDARVAERPVQVTPEGDHYHLAIPIKVTRGFTPETILLTGSARPSSGGRWTIEEMQFPSPSSFTVQMPTPPKAGQATPEPPIPLDYTVTAGSQENQGVYDPSFTTPSTLTTSVRDLKVTATSALTEQLTTVKRLAGIYTLRPSGTDRMDLIIDSTAEGYAVNSKVGDSQVIDFAAAKVRVTGEATAVSRDRIAKMIPVLVRITGGVAPGLPKPGSKAPAGTPSVDPQLLQTLVQSLQDFASELTMDETIDGIAVRYGQSAGVASQLRIGVGAKSDGSLLQARMDLGLDGLALPDMPPGGMADLLPRRIALRPVLSGVPTEQLLQLLTAVNAKEAGPPPDYAALFSRGGVSAGLESLTLDIGGANFAGMGAVTIDSPQRMTGQAQVTATNFDELMQRANSIPELAGVLPAFVFAKGIGRTVENRLVWDITYRDRKLLVNGTDLSAMAGARSR